MVEHTIVNRGVVGSSPTERVPPKPRVKRFGVSIAESNIGRYIAAGFGSLNKHGNMCKAV